MNSSKKPDSENLMDKRPNVIWVFGDQHRAQALGCSGDPNVHTPNIDSFSSMGVNFTSAVAGFPLCCPFRGSLLTGIYPHKVVPGNHVYRLPPEQLTIADTFNEAGYNTAYFGKWHLDGNLTKEDSGYHSKREGGGIPIHLIPPDRRGRFKHWVGYQARVEHCVHGGEGEDSFQYKLSGYETDALTDLLIQHIKKLIKEQNKGNRKPFFAVLSVLPPHDPFIAPEEFMKRHTPGRIVMRPNVPNVASVMNQARRELAGYYAMIENLDWNFGRIMKVLTETGILPETHVMFFSDHGDMHGSHGQFRKTSPYEESIRIPFIIGGGESYNGRRGARFPVPVNHVDIAPTTLGLCGISKPDWMEGTDYSHYRIKSREAVPEPDSAFLQYIVPPAQAESIDNPWRGVVTNDGWKYVCFEGVPWMMHNLNEDPYEQVNLAHYTRYSVEKKHLNDRLGQWILDTGDKFVLP